MAASHHFFSSVNVTPARYLFPRKDEVVTHELLKLVYANRLDEFKERVQQPRFELEITRDKTTLLHELCYNSGFGKKELSPKDIALELLLVTAKEKKWDLNLVNNNNQTPLNLAVLSGNLYQVKLLLNAGALAPDNNISALKAAATIININCIIATQIIAELINANMLVEGSLHWPNSFLFKLIKIDLECRNPWGICRPYPSLFNSLNQERLKILLESVDGEGNTLLHWLILNSSYQKGDQLLWAKSFSRSIITTYADLGISLEIKNNNGMTPLRRAFTCIPQRGTLWFKALVKNGADINAKIFHEEKELSWLEYTAIRKASGANHYLEEHPCNPILDARTRKTIQTSSGIFGQGILKIISDFMVVSENNLISQHDQLHSVDKQMLVDQFKREIKDYDTHRSVQATTCLLVAHEIDRDKLLPLQLGPMKVGGSWSLKQQLCQRFLEEKSIPQYVYFQLPTMPAGLPEDAPAMHGVSVVINMHRKIIFVFDPQNNAYGCCNEALIRLKEVVDNVPQLKRFQLLSNDLTSDRLQKEDDELNCGIYGSLIMTAVILVEEKCTPSKMKRPVTLLDLMSVEVTAKGVSIEFSKNADYDLADYISLLEYVQSEAKRSSRRYLL